MGCTSSKSTTAIDDTKAAATATATKRKATSSGKKDNKMAASAEYPASEAFTIPLDDAPDSGDQLNDTLRQPPRRLQQLMQQAADSEPPTLLELQERQQRAEQRRQELMQLKIETIQKTTQQLLREPGEQSEAEELQQQPKEGAPQ